ncbi:MAG: copper-binding protein [Gallionellaceae bacterium]|jgi:Cu/Ag efflux protein CusF
MFKSTTLSLSAVVLLLASNLGNAEEMKGMGNMNMQQDMGSAAMQVHKGHGVANKINAAAGKVNITHEPIESMQWPKMTMDFTVQNKEALDAIKPGMAVDFEITQKGKGYRITNIVPAK